MPKVTPNPNNLLKIQTKIPHTYKLYNWRPKYWPTARKSTGGQTREGEKIKSRN